MKATSLTDFISSEALSRLEAETDEIVRGLPGCVYTHEGLLRHEYDRLYSPSWIYVGNTHDIPNPGDAEPVSLFGQPVLLVRNLQGKVNAFHNACRHRGTRLVPTACSGLRSLVCPYHAWTYDLDGKLKSSPHFGGYQRSTTAGFDATEFGLQTLRLETFADWLFVNPDGNAQPLCLHLAALLSEIEAIDFSQLTHFLSLDFGEVPVNWKLMLENSLENYHVPQVHAETAGQHRLEDHFCIVRDHCIGTGINVAADHQASADAFQQGGPDSLNMSARYLALMPNFFLVTYAPDILLTHHRLPLSATNTRFKVNAYTTSGRTPDTGAIAHWRQLALKVQREDIAIQLEQQAGRASPVTHDGGVLSPVWEQSVRAFHRYLITNLK